MRGRGAWRATVLLTVVTATILVLAAPTAAAGRMEFGVAVPISTSFSFSSISYGLEGYARFLLGALAWELALKTYTTFDTLYIRNTLSTVGGFFLAIGHVTNLLPYFGSTYFTFGAGLAMGQALVLRLAANLAVSVGGGLYPFLEFRFQLGLDP